MNLKEDVKNLAYELGADLVGVGNIGRCRHAPSPALARVAARGCVGALCIMTLLLWTLCPIALGETGVEGSAAPQAAPAGKRKDALEKKSFWFIGTSNYHLRLEESEKKIDAMLNEPFGALLPRWDPPTTFKDWSDDFRLWDIWAGFGRDISAKSSWSIYAGGGAGTVRNRDRYFPLGLPVKLEDDFFRRSLFVGSSVSYYPFGRPAQPGDGLRSRIKATRPVGEINVGYTHQTVVGDVTASLPILGDVIHIKDAAKYHLFWVSPRLGVEIPLTRDDSLNILGGYLFFHDHPREFNGALIEFFVRHRF